MTEADLKQLYDRMKRMMTSLGQKEGPGVRWGYTFPDGMTTTYHITNIKTFEQLKDDVETLCLWVWNAKDYLREYAITRGKDPKCVEDFVNKVPNLQICADLANTLKHYKLKKGSRSSKFPAFGNVGYSIDLKQCAEKIVCKGTEIEVHVAKPDEVVINCPVLDQHGNIIGDAIAILKDCIDSWETLLKDLEV